MRALAIATLLLTGALVPDLNAQVAVDDSITTLLRAAGDRYSRSNVVLWVEEGALSTDEAQSFAQSLSAGIERVEKILQVGLDTVHYSGGVIEVFVARGVGISHVYGSYEHQRYDRPYLYLDASKVRSREAPYLHELTHIIAWSFGSHSLREGLASYVEATVRASSGASRGACSAPRLRRRSTARPRRGCRVPQP